MTNKQLHDIKSAFMDCQDEVQNIAVRHDIDDGDASSHQGWIADADNMGDLCMAMIEWIKSLEANNAE